ncbi:MAG TPA: hypothetical protein VGL13_14415, partial [Polyangiaceae bacterium]
MSEISRTTLFGKLDELSYRAIESATVFCRMRGNPYVELVHWLHQLLQQSDSDLLRAVRHYQLDQARLARDLTESLDRLPRGASSVSDLSVHVEESVERGWVYATLMFDSARIRTGHLLIGWLKTTPLRNALLGISREFAKVKADEFADQFAKLTSGSVEEKQSGGSLRAGDAAPAEGEGPVAPAAMGKQEALGRYSVDLTERARKGEIDPVLGRDDEIRQIFQVLMRRRQNNPILTGEAGVGKTAVVEGLALRIAKGDVPPSIQDITIRTLDLGL